MLKRMVYEKDGYKVLWIFTDIYCPGHPKDYLTGFWPDKGARHFYDCYTLSEVFEAMLDRNVQPNLPDDVERYYREKELPRAEKRKLPDYTDLPDYD